MLYIIRVLYFYYDCGMTIRLIDHTIIINKEHFMKIAFLIPVLEDIDISRTYDIIKESCDGTDFEIIFAINGTWDDQTAHGAASRGEHGGVAVAVVGKCGIGNEIR